MDIRIDDPTKAPNSTSQQTTPPDFPPQRPERPPPKRNIPYQSPNIKVEAPLDGPPPLPSRTHGTQREPDEYLKNNPPPPIPSRFPSQKPSDNTKQDDKPEIPPEVPERTNRLQHAVPTHGTTHVAQLNGKAKPPVPLPRNLKLEKQSSEPVHLDTESTKQPLDRPAAKERFKPQTVGEDTVIKSIQLRSPPPNLKSVMAEQSFEQLQAPTPHQARCRSYIDVNEEDSDNEEYHNLSKDWSSSIPKLDQDEEVNNVKNTGDLALQDTSPSKLVLGHSLPLSSLNSSANNSQALSASNEQSIREHQNGRTDPTEPNSLPWYWGNITAEEVMMKLENQPDGTFLLRDSNSSMPGSFTLCVMHDGEIRKLKILKSDGQCTFIDLKDRRRGRIFESIQALVNYYNDISLAEYSNQITSRLAFPVQKKETRKVLLIDALSILADRGRQLNAVQYRYMHLLEEQANLSKCLQLDTLQVKAVEASKSMMETLFQPLSGKGDDDEINQLSEEQLRKFSANNRLAKMKLTLLSEHLFQLEKEKKIKEKKMNENVLLLNQQAILLKDHTEDCEFLKRQVLKFGVKPEFVDCLFLDCHLQQIWDRSLWLVKCSGKEANDKLTDTITGTFLIRPRDSVLRPYALSIMCTDEEDFQAVRHCFIFHVPKKGYGFRPEAAVFESIEELVARHAQTSIKMYFSNIDTCLAYPVFLKNE